MAKRMNAVATAVAVALALVACESTTENKPPPLAALVVDPDKPCDLLSPAQVQDAIHTQVHSEEEVDSHDPETRICSYKTAQPWSSVEVSLDTPATHAQFDEEMKRDPINTEPVHNVGEGAFIQGCTGIRVFARGVLAWGSVQHFTTCEETRVVLERLARTIVAAILDASNP